MNVALPIVSQLVQVWVDSRKDGSKTTEIPFINDHRRTFTLIFHLNATVSFDAIDAKYLFWMINTLRAGVNRVQKGGFSVPYYPRMGQFDIRYCYCMVVVLL